jgi:hypothetical protein
MYVCFRHEWSCMCVLDMSGHVCVCYTWVVMYVCVRHVWACMGVLDMSGHVCVC